MTLSDPPTTTATTILDTATRLFAERGFYGVSLAAIAGDLGLTKQALLHHFKTKERLYGAVLAQLSGRFEDTIAQAKGDSPEERFVAWANAFAATALAHPEAFRLVQRELMDNKQRAEDAKHWYMGTFLGDLTRLLQSCPCWAGRSEAEARAAVYQVLGALGFFLVSDPTLERLFGADGYADMRTAFPDVLAQHIASIVTLPGESGGAV